MPEQNTVGRCCFIKMKIVCYSPSVNGDVKDINFRFDYTRLRGDGI